MLQLKVFWIFERFLWLRSKIGLWKRFPNKVLTVKMCKLPFVDYYYSSACILIIHEYWSQLPAKVRVDFTSIAYNNLLLFRNIFMHTFHLAHNTGHNP